MSRANDALFAHTTRTTMRAALEALLSPQPCDCSWHVGIGNMHESNCANARRPSLDDVMTIISPVFTALAEAQAEAREANNRRIETAHDLHIRLEVALAQTSMAIALLRRCVPYLGSRPKSPKPPPRHLPEGTPRKGRLKCRTRRTQMPPTEPEERTRLGARLKEAREYLSISQEESARAAGISRSAMSLLEAGQRKVGALELKKLARLYGRPVEHFTGEDDEPVTSPSQAHLARAASKLSERDREEVLRFARFLQSRADDPEDE